MKESTDDRQQTTATQQEQLESKNLETSEH